MYVTIKQTSQDLQHNSKRKKEIVGALVIKWVGIQSSQEKLLYGIFIQEADTGVGFLFKMQLNLTCFC